jgi:hypothetical protein
VGLIAPGPARADPRLDEKVYEPYVESHEAELEIRNGQELGGALGGAATTVTEAEYGFNDHVSLSILAANARGPGEAARWTAVGLESVVYLGPVPNIGVDAGLYFEYAKGLNGEADGAEFKLLLAKNAGRFEGLLNLIAERPVGDRNEAFASYGYAASATWRTVGKLRLGVEAFGDLGSDHSFLGRQGAYVGPKLKWQPKLGRGPTGIEVEAAYLAPFGQASAEGRGQVRLNLEIERRF